jgi:muramidase (phage lysozyme)
MNYPAQVAAALGVACLAAVVISAALDSAAQAHAEADEADGPYLQFDPFASVSASLSDMQTALTQDARAASNERAFLLTIRHAEGTAGPNGYRTLFGGSLFDSFADHPRIAKRFRHKTRGWLWTSAAGAYQAMAVSPIPGGGSTGVNTWDRMKKKLGLPDFSPASQDAFALGLIRDAGALPDVRAGRFAQAVDKVREIWASLPGSTHGQPQKGMPELVAVFQRNGGALA